MTGFITMMVLICQTNLIPGHKGLYCHDKGTVNLRGSLVKEAKTFEYFKCNDKYFKDCNVEIKWDGCSFVTTDKKQYYSSTACP